MDLELVGVAHIPGSLPIHAALVGGQYEVGGSASSVTFRFPETDERLAKDEPPYAGWAGVDDAPISRELVDFEVIVGFSVEVDSQTASDPSSPAFERLREAIDAAHAIARAKVSLLHRWARLSRPWLGHGDPDATRVTDVIVRRLDTGDRIRIGPTVSISVVIMNAPPVTPSEMGELVRQLRTDTEPPPTSSMLADALFLGRWREPSDGVGAILLGAIACEVKAKEVLLELATSDTSRLLDLMLTDARAFPRPAQELFHTVPRAVLGRSMQEEEPEAFQRLSVLFKRRNAIAHRGEIPDDEKVSQCLLGAESACSWLDSLVG
jgi:hypothetical protein